MYRLLISSSRMVCVNPQPSSTPRPTFQRRRDSTGSRQRRRQRPQRIPSRQQCPTKHHRKTPPHPALTRLTLTRHRRRKLEPEICGVAVFPDIATPHRTAVVRCDRGHHARGRRAKRLRPTSALSGFALRVAWHARPLRCRSQTKGSTRTPIDDAGTERFTVECLQRDARGCLRRRAERRSPRSQSRATRSKRQPLRRRLSSCRLLCPGNAIATERTGTSGPIGTGSLAARKPNGKALPVAAGDLVLLVCSSYPQTFGGIACGLHFIFHC